MYLGLLFSVENSMHCRVMHGLLESVLDRELHALVNEKIHEDATEKTFVVMLASELIDC
jgi:hypothetical protein